MHDALGAWLWRSAQLEAYAAGVAARLTRGRLVTAEERDFVGDVVFKEELEHRDALRGMARALDVPLPDPARLPTLRDVPELRVLMLLTRGEGALLLERPKFRRMFEHARRDEFTAGFQRIVDDERGHRAWSRRLVHRLRGDGVEVPGEVLRTWQPFHEVRALVDAVREEQA